MKALAVIYHSAHGHTEHIALQVAAGASRLETVDVRVLRADELARAPELLLDFDGLVFGSPTYLGGVSGPFKSFMDSTGRMWRQQSLKGKLASGFTVSSLPAGDKQPTLMAQAGHAAAADAFVPGDIKTARMFGENFAQALLRISP